MITAQLATIPERLPILPKVIDSLLPQVDILNVMLNNYTPDQVTQLMNISNAHRWERFDDYDHIKLRFWVRNNQKTDGEKYYQIELAEPGYIFICDDDILYPYNYVDYMVRKIEQYERKAVISLHGRVWNELPITSFYRDRSDINPWDDTYIPNRMYRCLEDVEGDHRVHCCGDGVSAWHTDTLKMTYEDIEEPDMSQLWLALKCNKLDIPQIVVEHKEGFIENLLDDDMFQTSIWNRNKDDKRQTQIINSRWIIR